MKNSSDEMLQEIINWARDCGYTVSVSDYYSVPRKGRHNHRFSLSVQKIKNFKCKHCNELDYKFTDIFKPIHEYKKDDYIQNAYNQMIEIRSKSDENI